MAKTPTDFETQCVVHLESVYRMALRLARDEAEAHDLVQETYVRAFKAFDKFELRAYGVKPWLLRILHNAFYSHREKVRRQPTLLDDVSFDQFTAELEAADDAGGLGGVDWDRFDGEIKRAVEGLASEYRTVLLLWSFENMSYKQIAEVCGCPVGTVMSRLYRARQVLGQKLSAFNRGGDKDRAGSRDVSPLPAPWKADAFLG